MNFDPNLLRYHTAIRGWDQHQLSRASGVSEATISRVMAGQSMRPLTALQLARAFREHRAHGGDPAAGGPSAYANVADNRYLVARLR